MKKFAPQLLIIITWTILMTLSLRGHPGNPSLYSIEFQQNSSGQPFETSQERSRWALLLSLFNEKTFYIDKYASIGTPDIGFTKGHYYSFFPPGFSVLALPFYFIGSWSGNTQLIVFLMPSLFLLFTSLLIFKFCQKTNLHWSTGLFASFGFAYATNAWGYSVTLYTHIISAFLLLLSIYLTLFNKPSKTWKSLIVWILYGISGIFDFPNYLIFLPVVIYDFISSFAKFSYKKDLTINLNMKWLIGPVSLILILCFYGYFNYANFGSPTSLSNTIPRVRDLKDASISAPEKTKNAGQSLKSRNFIQGINSFIFSKDRSLIVFTPIVLIFLVALKQDIGKNFNKSLLFSVIFVCITLYSMFGDPFGGWAFGSRYMISVMPEMLILAAMVLQNYRNNVFVRILFSIVTIYSVSISSVAPITTNVIPPYVEARFIGLDSTYRINFNMLKDNSLNSYFYNHILNKRISGLNYYLIILSIALIPLMAGIWISKKNYEN